MLIEALIRILKKNDIKILKLLCDEKPWKMFVLCPLKSCSLDTYQKILLGRALKYVVFSFLANSEPKNDIFDIFSSDLNKNVFSKIFEEFLRP